MVLQIEQAWRKPQALAFEAEEAQFLEWIEQAQLAIEIEPIDDPDRGSQADVLGPQVPVAFPNAAALGAARKLRAQPFEQFALPGRQLRRDTRIEAGNGCRLDCGPVAVDFRAQTPAVFIAAELDRRESSVEVPQMAQQGIEIGSAHLRGADQEIEHPLRGQPAHLHQPVDGLACSRAQMQSTRRERNQRYDVEIYTRSERLIDAKLFPARRVSSGNAQRVDAVIANRLAQLVGMPGREKDPGKMSLDCLDRRAGLAEIRAIRQELRLLRERAISPGFTGQSMAPRLARIQEACVHPTLPCRATELHLANIRAQDSGAIRTRRRYAKVRSRPSATLASMHFVGLNKPQEFTTMNVASICGKNVVTIRGFEELGAAAQLMREKHIGYLVVIEPDVASTGSLKPIGVLTDRDIVISVVARETDPRTLRVSDVMTQNPVVTRDSDSLEQALARMRGIGVRRLPVVGSRGELVGVLSLDEIIDSLAAALQNIAGSIRNERRIETALRP